MRLTKKQLRKIIRESYIALLTEEEERAVFNPEDVDLPIPKELLKLLDPDITPKRFAELDAKLDTSGKPQHQAFAIAAFAMTYADNVSEDAEKIVKMALPLLKKIGNKMETEEQEE